MGAARATCPYCTRGYPTVIPMRPILDQLMYNKGLSKQALRRKTVTSQHRYEIGQKIGQSWELLASQIGIPPQDVQDIKETYPLLAQQCDMRSAMMNKWYELYGSDASYLKLMEGLERVGRRDLIESVLDDLYHRNDNDQPHRGCFYYCMVVLMLVLSVVVLSFLLVVLSFPANLHRLTESSKTVNNVFDIELSAASNGHCYNNNPHLQ